MSTDRSLLTSKEREKASVFHSWSAQGSLDPLMVRDAHGAYVTDEDGTQEQEDAEREDARSAAEDGVLEALEPHRAARR